MLKAYHKDRQNPPKQGNRHTMRTFALGDVHGNYKALMQVLERANFNYEEDTLIGLGDYCDGYPQTKEVIDELLKIKNLIPIMGNHDEWLREYFRKGAMPHIWVSQGGQATLESYDFTFNEAHLNFLDHCRYSYTDEKNRIFCHGGFPKDTTDILDVDRHIITWDRSLVKNAITKKQYSTDKTRTKYVEAFEEVWVGHTTTQGWKTFQPIIAFNIYLLDTGAGWDGKLTLMDVDSKEVFQSDFGWELYGENQGRGTY